MTAIRRCLPVVLAGFAVVHATGAEARNEGRATAVSVGADEMSYYRRSAAVVDSILSGDLGAALAGIAGLEGVARPRALVYADVHNAIGVAYGESGHFDAAIAHVGKALGRRDESPPGLVAESQAYLAYFHAALSQFPEAARALDDLQAAPPWLHAKLASAYAGHGNHACAVANAEAALRAGRAGGAVASRWTSSRTAGTVDREAVLEEWSRRLESLRRSAALEEQSSGGAARVLCVGA
ncbi:MAG: hypothetical protein OXH15_13945 [Gammaproteobacteria bacterium]|nr:hypothetical protein [Gammaproteobacteria bacterium]